MLKFVKYLLLFFTFFTACESVYLPDVEQVENVLVVDARLVYGQQDNKIILKKSTGFNERSIFESVTTASVLLTDDTGVEYPAIQYTQGEYLLRKPLDSLRKYKLFITVGEDIYASEFEAVPPVPNIDTLYGDHAELWIQPGGENNTGDFLKQTGQQLYVDINNDSPDVYFKFTARKIHQFYFPFDTVMFGQNSTEYKYGWKSYYPQEKFNIAGPAEYSSAVDIVRHPVEFFMYSNASYLDSTQKSMGWIYIMQQYSISESAYLFYKDVNSQLEANGKIFDPLYVQARNNIKCVSEPGKIVLGNFEISRYREHRYYIRLDRFSDNHKIRPVEVFYDIPPSGIQPLTLPWFWEL